MLPRADTLGTRPATVVEAPVPVTASGDARQEVFHRLAQIPLGRQFQAEVLKQLEDGTFVIKIADTQARVVLPKGTRVGDSVLMSLLTSQPRPVFLLNGEGGSAATQLSQAGRLISNLLQAAQQQNAPVEVDGTAPLLKSEQALLQPGGAPKTATAMQQALSGSGVFYESHLQEWLQGNRTATELAKEPQASFPRSRAMPEAAPATHEFAQLINHVRTWAGSEQSLAHFLRSLPPQLVAQSQNMTTDADTILAAQTEQGAASLPTEAVRTVNQQLHVLENRQIMWQGELWPGQKFEWEVADDTPSGRQDPDAEPAWRSSVRFHLPLLGDISASIYLRGNDVQVAVKTSSEATSAFLSAHGGALAEALSSAGAELRSFQVSTDEQA